MRFFKIVFVSLLKKFQKYIGIIANGSQVEILQVLMIIVEA